MKKTKLTSGADELTPSKSQYFSWINSTNEGSTDHQTLANLDYFKWLKDEYGMQLDIYAWDAGNLDGARETYETLSGEKLSKQYPDGYAPIAEKASQMGTKLGVWCGPDGFGNTPEEEKARYDLMTGLCRDHNFGLFKMDGVCGTLRKEKRDIFCKMMIECRKYSPELILLNHRLDFGKGNIHATTFLWEGVETYTDVHIANGNTAMHHRAYMFTRGHVPGLQRLTEDHGVCISSCADYFEDELIYQAFNRCLILAPEVYGNPWLLRDDEQVHLAAIYDLHRQYRDILVRGMLLDEKEYGCNAVSRGNGKIRFIATGNNSWLTKKISIKLDKSIGLEKCSKVAVFSHHPYTKYIGTFAYGDTVEYDIMPFRAALIRVCDESQAGDIIEGCEYEVIGSCENGRPKKIKAVKSEGRITLNSGLIADTKIFDETNRAPLLVGKSEMCDVPSNVRELVETAYFAVDSDSFEARELKRSGKTSVPQVQKARDEFFSQKTYLLRGCEGKYAFDGKDDTFFAGFAIKRYPKQTAINGGCLRVDFGDIYDADELIIDTFDFDETVENSVFRQHYTMHGEYSSDMKQWEKSARVVKEITERNAVAECVMDKVHNIELFGGNRIRLHYGINGSVRYFVLPDPVYRIYRIALIKDGREIKPERPFVNNVMPPYTKFNICASSYAEIEFSENDVRNDSYLSVAFNGYHGYDGVTAVIEIEGKYYGCPDRAVSYPSNAFECPVRTKSHDYTYFFPVNKSMAGKKIKVIALYRHKMKNYVPFDVWLCDGNAEKKGVIIDI